MNSYLILFDDMCNFCNFWVDFIIDRDRNKHFRFASLHSNVAQKILKEKNLDLLNSDTIVLVLNDIVFTKSSAALHIAKRLDGIWKLVYVFSIVPKPMRDLVYDLIARNRYKWFGKRDSCRIPIYEDRDRFLSE